MFSYIKPKKGEKTMRILDTDTIVGVLEDGTVEEKPENLSVKDFLEYLEEQNKNPVYQLSSFSEWQKQEEHLICEQLHHHIHKHYSCPIEGETCGLIAKEDHIFSIAAPDGQFFTSFTNADGEFDLKLCDETTGEPVEDQTLADAEKAKKLAAM